MAEHRNCAEIGACIPLPALERMYTQLLSRVWRARYLQPLSVLSKSGGGDRIRMDAIQFATVSKFWSDGVSISPNEIQTLQCRERWSPCIGRDEGITEHSTGKSYQLIMKLPKCGVKLIANRKRKSINSTVDHEGNTSDLPAGILDIVLQSVWWITFCKINAIDE